MLFLCLFLLSIDASFLFDAKDVNRHISLGVNRLAKAMSSVRTDAEPSLGARPYPDQDCIQFLTPYINEGLLDCPLMFPVDDGCGGISNQSAVNVFCTDYCTHLFEDLLTQVVNTGHCLSYFDTYIFGEPQCERNSDCGPNFKCFSGRCYPMCTSNADCTCNQTCGVNQICGDPLQVKMSTNLMRYILFLTCSTDPTPLTYCVPAFTNMSKLWNNSTSFYVLCNDWTSYGCCGPTISDFLLYCAADLLAAGDTGGPFDGVNQDRLAWLGFLNTFLRYCPAADPNLYPLCANVTSAQDVECGVPSEKSEPNVGAIVGAVIGSLAILLALGVGFYCYRKRKVQTPDRREVNLSGPTSSDE